MRHVLAILLLALTLPGCRSLDALSPADGQSFTVKGRSYNQIWNAAVLSVASIAAIESQDRAKGEVRGHRGGTMWSGGDLVAIFIEPPRNTSLQNEKAPRGSGAFRCI